MGNPKDIFKSHSILTEKEISDYLSGNLSEEQRLKIEQKISQDEFNFDAMEGIVSNPSAMVGYESARETVLKNIDKKSGGWQFHHSIILSVVLIIATMLFGSKLFPDSGQVLTETVVDKDTIPANPQSIIVTPVAPITELTDDEIEASIELPEIHLVKAIAVIETSPVVLDTMNMTTAPSKMTFDETVALKKVVANNAPDKIEVPTIEDVVYSNVPLFYMHKFLLVDYTRIYKEMPTITKLEFAGTPASLENKDDKLTEGQQPDAVQTIKIPYFDYLNETQGIFGKDDFKNALKRYKVILKTYPEDLNAHFYSGLCYYNIGKYDLAITHFDIAQKHAYNTFKIDAQWYKAKTYYLQGKQASAKAILTDIINEKDYYTSQAIELLKKIK